MRAITTLLLILIQDSGGRGQEVEEKVQKDMGRGQEGDGRRQEAVGKRPEDVRSRQKIEDSFLRTGGRRNSVVIKIEENVRQPYNCTAFLDILEVRRKGSMQKKTLRPIFDALLTL